MLLEKNGKRSAGNRSRHIHIRFFWINDATERNNMTIEYTSTQRMLGDFFSKPLQGEHFRRLRDVIMGINHISTLSKIPILSKNERVGQQEISA